MWETGKELKEDNKMKYHRNLTRTQKTELTSRQLDEIRFWLYKSELLKQKWIIGHNFCAVEIKLNEYETQGVSVVRKNDKFNVELGRWIALGKAVLRMALVLGNKLGDEVAIEFINGNKIELVSQVMKKEDKVFAY